MHFYSITVVIICKFFEVVKSNIIILMADCNNYLHTLSKKKLFLTFIIFGENKGRQVTKCPKKQNFGPTEVSGRWGGQRVQKSTE